MPNSARQPKVQRALPGTQRYADSTTNAQVGRNRRVETVDVSPEDSFNAPDTGQIAPEAPYES